eukprot:s3165_g12.t1
MKTFGTLQARAAAAAAVAAAAAAGAPAAAALPSASETVTAAAAAAAGVIGTFAGHPFVMASMNAFLKWLELPETTKSYDVMHANIDNFIKTANAKFQETLESHASVEKDYPIQLTNWFSVWSILYTKPGRYHWLFQYFLKDAGVSLSWVGTGRLLFSLEWKKEDYDRLLERLLAACEQMQKGGWWEEPKANIKAKLGVEIGTAVFKNVLGLTG